MTAGDMRSPILSRLGTTWSSDASSGSPQFVKTERGGSANREQEGKRAFFIFFGSVKSSPQITGEKKRTRLLSNVFFFTLEKRLISWVRVDLGLHEGVTEQ